MTPFDNVYRGPEAQPHEAMPFDVFTSARVAFPLSAAVSSPRRRRETAQDDEERDDQFAEQKRDRPATRRSPQVLII